MIRVQTLDHFVLRIRDLDTSLGFYRDLLGLSVEGLSEFQQGIRPFVSLRIGEQLLDLVPDPAYEASRGGMSGFLHFCLTVDAPLHSVIQRLRDAGTPFLHEEPVSRSGARGQALSIYVQDPDGYVVELKEF